MRWGIQQRLEFIEFRLYWEGMINRKDIIEKFNVSIPQASTDLKEYKKMAPGNIRYNKKVKHYLKTSKFKPYLISSAPKCYLSQLKMLSEGIIDENETLLGFKPEFEILNSIERSINTDILLKIIRAIRNEKAIRIEYQSMTTPSPVMRWITPHAYVYDGFRWHIRAYCEFRNEFRDFILGRIISINSEKNRDIDPLTDINWNQFVKIIIAPHPNLSDTQKKVIEHEYQMENGKIELTVRGALVYYVINRFRLENENLTCANTPKNLIIINNEEIEKFI